MAKKPKKTAKKKKGAEIAPEMVEIRKREATRKRLLGTIMDARDKKEGHTNKAASLAAMRQDEMKEANRWEKIETDAIEDILKIDGGGFVDRLPFGAADAPASDAGKAVAAVASGKPTLAQREKELAGVSLKDLGITGAQLDKLEADGIHNGDDLRKWLNKVPPAKIAGIGDAAREKLGDALSAWWMSHPFEDASKTSTKPAAATAKASTDNVIVGKIEIIASIPDTFSVYVAPRESGKLCFGFWIKSKHLPNLGEFEQDYFGHYEADNREKLYGDAFDACTEKVKEMEGGGLVGPREREICAKIHGAIIEAGKLMHKKTKNAAAEETVSLSFAGA